MKKLIIISAIVLVFVTIIGIWAYSSLNNNTVYDDPKSMSEMALECVFGWKDIDLFMNLTPYIEDTMLYDAVYDGIFGLMQSAGFEDHFSFTGYEDLKKADSDYYFTVIDILSDSGVTNVSEIRGYTYMIDGYDEITIYVAKIEKQWYTLSVDY